MKGFKLYIGIISAVILVITIALFHKPKDINWDDTLNKNHKIPFGTYIFYQNLPEIFQNQKFSTSIKPIYNLVADDSLTNHNIVIMAKTLSLSQLEVGKLFQLAAKGNNVFLTAYKIKRTLARRLKISISSEIPNKDVIIKFTNPKIANKRYIFKKGTANFYFDTCYYEGAKILSNNQYNHPTLIKFPYGKGSIIVSPNPLMFSNFNLIDKNNRDYAAKAMSYLPASNPIIFNDYYLIPVDANKSLLTTFLQYSSLKWAYYIGFFTLMMYILVNVKRRQRAIPLLIPLENTSLSFVRTISAIYYQQKDHHNLAQKKMNHFFEFVRSRYRLSPTTEEDFFNHLALKSGVDVQIIRSIFRFSAQLKKETQIGEFQLIDISNLIDKFYKNEA